MNEKDIWEFWNTHPCDEAKQCDMNAEYKEFFDYCDKIRYKQEGHILRCLDDIDFRNKNVLEIGLGLGADSEQIIRRGAIWSGIDLTQESVNRVAKRLMLRNLPYKQLKVGSVCALPFEDNTFDLVFSHGVLHHVPDISMAQAEIARVLKPGGQLIAMLYAKRSLNYVGSIFVLRRIALGILCLLGIKGSGIIGQHLENARKLGPLRYLRMSTFIHHNTDGPLNPYSKVYDMNEVKKDFVAFKVTKSHKEFMHAPPLPVSKLPLAPLLGWHLWVHMVPRK